MIIGIAIIINIINQNIKTTFMINYLRNNNNIIGINTTNSTFLEHTDKTNKQIIVNISKIVLIILSMLTTI